MVVSVVQRDSLATHSICQIRLIQTVGAALVGGGGANIRLVPGNIRICLLCLCAASGLM